MNISLNFSKILSLKSNAKKIEMCEEKKGSDKKEEKNLKSNLKKSKSSRIETVRVKPQTLPLPLPFPIPPPPPEFSIKPISDFPNTPTKRAEQMIRKMES